MNQRGLHNKVLAALEDLAEDPEMGLVAFAPLDERDLGPVCESAYSAAHNASYYKAADRSSAPPEWATELRSMLRRIHGRQSVGKIVAHVAECDQCGAKAVRYGVPVRVELGDGLVLEREFGEA